jgi:hypothetical protein
MVEGESITVQEVARTMLNESKILDKLWRDAIHTTSHIIELD